MNAIGRCLFAGCLIAAALVQGVPASAANWPERVVKFLLPAGAGSSVDVAARLFAERLSERWARPIVVENRPGADGILAVQSFLQANDDHTLLFTFPGVVTVTSLLHERLPYDPVNDLLPITSVAQDFLTVAITAALPASPLDDLVKLLRTRPGELNWAAAPGAPYLTFLEFQRRNGVKLAYVPYFSTILALPDLVNGQIHVLAAPLSQALPLARDGKLKLLAVTTPRRPPASVLGSDGSSLSRGHWPLDRRLTTGRYRLHCFGSTYSKVRTDGRGGLLGSLRHWRRAGCPVERGARQVQCPRRDGTFTPH